MKTRLLIVTLATLATSPVRAADTAAATNATNALGIDLLEKTGKTGENALLSPYSIQVSLAMAYAGADGKTRDEMAKALHFPKDGAELDAAFATLQIKMLEMMESSRAEGSVFNVIPKPKKRTTLAMVNPLFGPSGCEFRKSFLDLSEHKYLEPVEKLDFASDPDKARKEINARVEGQTLKSIQDLLPEQTIAPDTRLVLVGAIYLKMPFGSMVYETVTKPGAFYVKGGTAANVPMMHATEQAGYAKRKGYTAVAIPCDYSMLQFLVLMPDNPKGLSALEEKLTPELLAGCMKLDPVEVNIWLPKFKMEPPVMKLSGRLEALGMRAAFEIPRGSANFDGIAPRLPDDYLCISEVFHKVFFSLDENGADPDVMPRDSDGGGSSEHSKEVHVNHPFLFAVQDIKSGACLFIGRVTDPR